MLIVVSTTWLWMQQSSTGLFDTPIWRIKDERGPEADSVGIDLSDTVSAHDASKQSNPRIAFIPCQLDCQGSFVSLCLLHSLTPLPRGQVLCSWQSGQAAQCHMWSQS